MRMISIHLQAQDANFLVDNALKNYFLTIALERINAFST
jgi:hypothetical protein